MEPAAQLTAVFGAETLVRGVMVKFTSLVSLTTESVAHFTRTCAAEVVGPVTTQAKVPEVDDVVVMDPIGLHVPPPSRESSMFTGWPVPMVCENVMFFDTPACQLVAVFGAVTVIMGFTMVKSTSLTSFTVLFSTASTRIRAVGVAGPVTVHGYDPLVADVVVNVVMRFQLPPPSRLTSMFTCLPTPRLCVKVMFCYAVAFQLTAVFGAVTVTTPVLLEIVRLAPTVCVNPPPVPVIVNG